MNMEQTLSGRVAIVTGGARGIGLAIVEELHRRGACVLLADSGVSIAGADPDPSLAQSIAMIRGQAGTFVTLELADSNLHHTNKFTLRRSRFVNYKGRLEFIDP